MKRMTYAEAGVDTQVGAVLKDLIGRLTAATFNEDVMAVTDVPQLFDDSKIKRFKALFRLPRKLSKPVLVASVDGIGTKVKVATALERYDGLGVDLVHHSVNDILIRGARPLFFLDYIAMSKLRVDTVQRIVNGMVAACKSVHCAIIGGETAEMPGVYRDNEMDIVGCIVGAVEQNAVIDGHSVVPGDVVIGLSSSGLHTNGYSLVRRVFGIDERPVHEWNVYYPELGRTLGEELLEPHRCYYAELKPVISQIKGLAHITGGGFEANLPRCLPLGVAARIRRRSWQVPPVFRLIQSAGVVDESEMFRVFNMGIGMCVISSPDNVSRLLGSLSGAVVIGEIVAGERRVILE